MSSPYGNSRLRWCNVQVMTYMTLISFVVLSSLSSTSPSINNSPLYCTAIQLKGTSSRHLHQLPISSSSSTIQRERNLQKSKDKSGLPKKRDCELKSKHDDEVEYSCKAVQDDSDSALKVKDQIKFRVSATSEGAKLQVEYSNKVDTSTSSTKNDNKRRNRRIQSDTTVSMTEEDPDETPVVEDETNEPNVETAEGKDDTATTEVKDDVEAPQEEDGEDVKDSTMDDKNQQATSSTETKTKYEITYDRIVEYRKGNNTNNDTNDEDEDSAYDFDNDIVVQTIPLNEWSKISTITDDGDKSTFVLSSVDEMVQFQFIITRGGTASSDSTDATSKAATTTQSNPITANKIKFDFIVEDFPWQYEDSYIALLSTVQSERMVNVQSNDKVGNKDKTSDVAVVDANSNDNGAEGTATTVDETKQTKRMMKKNSTMVQISFDDAINGTGGFVTNGEYTWAKTAKASSSSMSSSNSSDSPTDSSDSPSSSPPLDANTSSETNSNEKDIKVMATALVEDDSDANDASAQDNVGPAGKTNNNNRKQTIAFSFVGPGAQSASKIYWDPEAGISYQEESSSSASSVSNRSTLFVLLMLCTSSIVVIILMV